MSSQLHGIAYNNSSKQGRLYYSIIHLLHLLGWYTSTSERKMLPKWPNRWIDNKALQAATKFQDCFWKIDRTATLLFISIENLQIFYRATSIDECNVQNPLNADIPIYLDVLLLYLRMQADCLANLIPNFYGEEGKKQSIPRDSFRAQMKWFIQKNPKFDSDYRTILLENTEWFRVLAGDQNSQGLRDVLTHYRGTYQMGWLNEIPKNIEDLKASMINESGYIEEDLIPEIIKVMELYFVYLDLTYYHFIEVIRKQTQALDLLVVRGEVPYITISDAPLRSMWIYPKLQETNKSEKEK